MEGNDLDVETGELFERDGKLVQIICDIEIVSPKIPALSRIEGYKLPELKQKFQLEKNLPQPEDSDALADKMWNYRKNGKWFMLKGQPMWISGTYWFFLNEWRMDSGLPNYRDVDRKRFWMLWHSDNDDCSYGITEIARRRDGKSYRGGVWLYDRITKGSERHGGIQSKTDKDSRSFFSQKIVQPWRKLSWYFKPTHASTSNPKTSLEFFGAAKKGKEASDEILNDNELGSYIDQRGSNELAYDGEALYGYVRDEVAKTANLSVWNSWEIVKPCLEKAPVIFGKAFIPTTVEDMDKNGDEAYILLWKRSNQKRRNSNGQTQSGLYRMFFPAWEGLIIDEWGFTKEVESKRWIAHQRENKSGIDLAGLKRKYPLSVSEAFSANTKGCHFNAEKIDRRLQELLALHKPLYNRYTLRWKDGIKDGTVYASPDPNGRWYITRLPLPEEQNIVSRDSHGRPKSPGNTKKFRSGADPFDNDVTIDNRRSDGVFAIKRRYDPTIDMAGKSIRDFETNRYVCFYKGRPAPRQLYEDAIMTCVFWGMAIHPETNKPGLVNEMNLRGYKNFVQVRSESLTTINNRQKDAQGAPSSAMAKEVYVSLIDSYIDEDVYGYEEGNGYWQMIDFDFVLTDLLKFDKENTQKYDLTVAMGFCELGDNDKIKPRNQTPVSHESLMVKFSQAGEVSQRIE